MEIRGNLGYLSITEQIDSGLSSPIDINNGDFNLEYQTASYSIKSLIHPNFGADTSEDVKASIRNQLRQAKSRSIIYGRIISELVIRNRPSS